MTRFVLAWPRAIRLSAALGLACVLAAPAALAQAPRQDGARPARPDVSRPAENAAPRVLKGPVTVVSGSVFRWRNETFQIADIRAPRARTGACTFERLRGREARKALRRILSRGDIVVTPVGRVTSLGHTAVRATVRGRDVRRALIEGGFVLPRRAGQPSNPWCL